MVAHDCQGREQQAGAGRFPGQLVDLAGENVQADTPDNELRVKITLKASRSDWFSRSSELWTAEQVFAVGPTILRL